MARDGGRQDLRGGVLVVNWLLQNWQPKQRTARGEVQQTAASCRTATDGETKQSCAVIQCQAWISNNGSPVSPKWVS